ncbi:hypothetical protein Tco_1314067 [Tanacetum coccineum]
MELENTQNNALAKLPMLKLGEYEMWEIRIKQYFQIQDYALWVALLGRQKVNTVPVMKLLVIIACDAIVYAFLSTQPQGSQLDLEQLHDDDLKENG